MKLHQIAYNNKKFMVYSSGQVRRFLGIKFPNWQRMMKLGIIPRGPIVEKSKRGIHIRQYMGSEPKSRYYTEEMFLIIMSWYKTIKADRAVFRPTLQEKELLNTKFNQAVENFLRLANDEKQADPTPTIETLLYNCLKGMTQVYKSKDELKIILYAAFCKACDNYLDEMFMKEENNEEKRERVGKNESIVDDKFNDAETIENGGSENEEEYKD